jgi:hypothetical protein
MLKEATGVAPPDPTARGHPPLAARDAAQAELKQPATLGGARQFCEIPS